MRRFKDFAETIISKTHLGIEGGITEITFLEYITSMKDELISFETKARAMHEEWSSAGGSFLSEADFFVKHGEQLFKLWLTELFPFNKDELVIKTASHGAVDSQYKISYMYGIDELILIRTALTKNGMPAEEKAPDASTYLLINATKSISKTFSSILNMDYKIFTANIEIQKDEFSLLVNYEAAGRIRK
ncbi:MAG: hypothetical protein ACXQS8_07960 [Candidatus Helarchaeales archaeon]